MATSAETVSGLPESKAGEIARRVAETCWLACNKFLDWERDFVLKAKPGPEVLEKHRQDLKWLIRMIKVLHAMASDPEFPDRSAEADFRLLLERLNHSWQLIQEPGMSDEEADRILSECFPNGPGA